MFRQTVRVCPVDQVFPQKPEMFIVLLAQSPATDAGPLFPLPIPPSAIVAHLLFEKETLPAATFALMLPFRFTQVLLQILELEGVNVTIGAPLYKPLKL